MLKNYNESSTNSLKIKVLVLGVIACFFAVPACPQGDSAAPPSSMLVKCGKLLDVRKGSYLENAAIWVEGERIKEAGPASQVVAHAPKNVQVIDLGQATVLPGLIDCHTHLMASFAGTPDGYLLGLATKSQAFRALEGAANARTTLQAGLHRSAT